MDWYQERQINPMWFIDILWGDKFVQVIYNLLFGDTETPLKPMLTECQ